MTTDNLGDRMKRYEAAFSFVLPPRLPIAIRVDGRSFHKFTEKMQQPFDENLMAAMAAATDFTAQSLQGCILAYTQSDEATFILQTDRDHASQTAWGGNLIKIVSTTASAMTAYFTEALRQVIILPGLPQFDARAFVLPWEEVPNCILWRYKDWHKNSVTMAALAHFHHRDLQGKCTKDKLGMLQELGAPWEALIPRIRHGHFWGAPLAELAEANVIAGASALTYADIKGVIDELRTPPSETAT